MAGRSGSKGDAVERSPRLVDHGGKYGAGEASLLEGDEGFGVGDEAAGLGGDGIDDHVVGEPGSCACAGRWRW